MADEQTAAPDGTAVRVAQTSYETMSGCVREAERTGYGSICWSRWARKGELFLTRLRHR
jgi:hypothetical protein